jgi:hypothetical protein
LPLLLAKLGDLPVALQRAAHRAWRRWVNNPRISAKRLLVSARRTLLEPLRDEAHLVVAHDSSEIDQHGRDCPDDAGPLRSSNARGYLTHWAVASALGGARFGAIDAWAWTRSWDLRKQDHHQRDMADKESSKWDRGIHRAERLLRAAGFSGQLSHVEDREADIYEHLVHQKQAERDVVVRCDLARKPCVFVGLKRVPLETFLATLPAAATFKRTVDSRLRDKKRGLTHQKRQASLEIRFSNVTRCPTKRYTKEAYKKGLPLGVVEVREVHAPEGVEPLHWILWCIQPVNNLEEARQAVAKYETRWSAEDFFFVSKTGCDLEKAHVDSLESFQRLMVVVMVAATHLVRWVNSARTTPAQPAGEQVEPETVQAIREACDFHRISCPRRAWTIGEMVLVLARLGGYEPGKEKRYGWRVVWRGWARVREHQAIVSHDRSQRSVRAGPAR